MENYINTRNGYLSSNNIGTVNNDLFYYFNKHTEFMFLYCIVMVILFQKVHIWFINKHFIF